MRLRATEYSVAKHFLQDFEYYRVAAQCRNTRRAWIIIHRHLCDARPCPTHLKQQFCVNE
jgi:hypothetical protein